MTRKPVVYIAGPYTNPDPVVNTNRAVQVGMGIRDRLDVGVLIPHLSMMAHAIQPRSVDYWYDFDVDLLLACDALVRIPGASTGADREVDIAIDAGLKVCFVDEVFTYPLDVEVEAFYGLRDWRLTWGAA